MDNLKGQRFGKLVVLEREGSDTRKYVTWKCICDCGNEKIVNSSNLKRSQVQSCGCLRLDKVIDETGNKYGKLEVIKRAKNNKAQRAMWVCQCFCGNQTNVRGSDLRNGKVQSCGCTKSRGEEAITKILQEFGIHYEIQYTFSDLLGEGGGLLRFDFAIFKNNKLTHLIEFDGKQHFNKSSRYYDESVVKHDNLKNEYCKRNKIKLLRFRSYENLTIEDLI